MAQSLKQVIAENPWVSKWIQRRIVEPFDPENPPPEFKEGKFLIFVGGGQAAGKTTLLNHVFNKLAEDGYDKRYIVKMGSFIVSDFLENPFVRTFRGMISKLTQSAMTHPEQDTVIKSLTDKALDDAVTRGTPIIIDYHMDDEKFVERALEKAKAHGYETILIAPHISAETYFSRAADRAKRTGRSNDTVFGLKTHKGFAERIDRYMDEFDLSVFVSNEKNHQPLSPIAVATHNGMEVFDEQAYQEMHRKAHINIHAKSPEELYEGVEQRPADEPVSTDGARVGKSHAADDAARDDVPEGKFTQMIKKMLVDEELNIADRREVPRRG